MRRNRYSSKSYRPRSVRHFERKGKRKIIWYFAFILLLLYVFFFWGIPIIIKTVSRFNHPKSAPRVGTDYVELTPPVFNIPYEATPTASIRILGYSQPNTKVAIYLNDELATTVNTSEDGTFESSALSLDKGENYLYGKTVDSSGKESLSSKSIRIVLNVDKPILEVFEPQDNKIVTGGDRKITVKGKTDALSISINGSIVIIASDGSFSNDLQLQDGETQITIVATNSVGSSTTIQRKVTYSP